METLSLGAVFVRNGNIYVLIKNRSNSNTKLYRHDNPITDAINSLTFVDYFDIGGLVTGSDLPPDGKYVAVLTYRSVWLFEPGENESLFLMAL